MRIETIAGPIEAEELGPTLMHEHLLALAPAGFYSGGDPNDLEDLAPRALAGLSRLGAKTLVDLSGASRVSNGTDDFARLHRLGPKLPFHIVAGFSFYKDPWLEMSTENDVDQMTRRYLDAGTAPVNGVRVGIFGEVGTSLDRITAREEIQLRAVARAHLEVGLAISTHCTLGTMALTHYIINSGIVAVGAAFKTDQPIWQTWHKHYLWTSITYFSGAIAAGVIAGLVYFIGAYAFVITLPIIAFVFLTYRTYLKNVETSAAQAAQAEKHVKELSHYIAEQERIREQFSQMEKLSALGELASGVAHDFNNTLAGILGRAQLLQRTDDPEKIKRGLEIIIKTAEDGAKTVKRIQDFARQRRDHDFELVSIDQILLDASEITRPRWKNCAEASNIHITVDLLIGSNAMVMGDDS